MWTTRGTDNDDYLLVIAKILMDRKSVSTAFSTAG